MQEPAKKRRRWDVAAPVPANRSSSDEDQQQKSTKTAAALEPAADPVEIMRKQAAAIAAKLTRGSAAPPLPHAAIVATPASLLPAQQQQPPSQHHHVDIPLNDYPAEIRTKFVRRPQLAKIEDQCGVNILVKGRYYPEGSSAVDVSAVKEHDLPLFLRIHSGQLLSLYRAREHILNLIHGAPVDLVTSHFVAAEKLGTHAVEKVYFPVSKVPLEEFDAAAKLAGPNDSYLEHIKSATGAACTVQGSATSTEDPLCICVSMELDSLDALESCRKAVGLAYSLVNTIKAEFDALYPVGGSETYYHVRAPGLPAINGEEEVRPYVPLKNGGGGGGGGRGENDAYAAVYRTKY